MDTVGRILSHPGVQIPGAAGLGALIAQIWKPGQTCDLLAVPKECSGIVLPLLGGLVSEGTWTVMLVLAGALIGWGIRVANS